MAKLKHYSKSKIIAGCDEAGRGCLAGPVFAASVILPKGFRNKDLDDSKKLSKKKRELLREIIIDKAISYSIAKVNPAKIDKINILNASFLAMHKAIKSLDTKPELLLIDGNRFNPYTGIEHTCIIEGDGKFYSIAAASILAKTARDNFMVKLSKKFPIYGWESNKGYATQQHRFAVRDHGRSPHHRKTFIVKELDMPELF